MRAYNRGFVSIPQVGSGPVELRSILLHKVRGRLEDLDSMFVD